MSPPPADLTLAEPLPRGDQGGRDLPGALRLAVVFGTRPEVIKLWPVLRALGPAVRARRVDLRVLSTGQQRDLLDQALAFFQIAPDHDLDLMAPDRPGEPLDAVFGRAVGRIGAWLRAEAVGRVIVQGDTLSAFASGLAAWYAGVRVSHVEAGLRTGDLRRPFPEELHRRVLTMCADQHFCPTAAARRHALADGADPATVHLVGNTVVDALRLVAGDARGPAHLPAAPGRRLLVTVHRRENHARLSSELLPAVRRVVRDHPDVDAVVSVHPNPAVRHAVARSLAGVERIHLCAPLSYPETIALVRQASIVVTDSGGLQEEAATLGTPLVVLRAVTERFEAVQTGRAVLPGAGGAGVARAIAELLDDPERLAAMSRPGALFGDGHAAERIAEQILMSAAATAGEGAA